MHVVSLRSRIRTFTLTITGAALALMLGRDAFGFNRDEGGSWSGQGSLPIRVQLGAPANMGSIAITYPLLDGSPTFNESCLQAIRLWNHYLAGPGPGPVMTPTVQATGLGGSNDGLNTIFFAPNVFGSGFGGNVLAVTVWNGPVGTSTGMDIIFNTARKWDSYRGFPHFLPPNNASLIDFQRVAIHELGHLLGIDHPDQSSGPNDPVPHTAQFVTAIMNSTIGGLDIMADDDIQGINVLYNGFPLFTPPADTSTPGTVGLVTNLSTRLNVLNGSSSAIPGFIVTGTGTKKVLVRAIGPSLTQFGITGALQAPTMTLYQGSTPLVTNTGWKTLPQNIQNQLTAAGQAPEFDAECAILMDLSASTGGAGYTVVVSGVGGTTGTGRVDIIDFEPTNTAAKITNVSTRGQVQTGQNVMIGGFIINGTLPKQLWIRAVGPTLGSFGVPGTITDPTLTIFDSAGNQVYVNNDWQSAQQQQIQTVPTIQPGFPKEPAVIINLPPGAYTVVVSGVGGVTGNGRVDIYDGDNAPH